MTRTEFLGILARLADEIDEDVVTHDDSRALGACDFLRYYLLDHMTEELFGP